MKNIARIFYLISLLAIPYFAFCQVALSGPSCVVPGITYQYKITGNWDSTSTLQVCITGGVIADTAGTNSCTPTGGAPLYSVLVIWNDTTGASLHIVSSAGNNTLNVMITSPLLAGSIDTLSSSQIIGYDSLPTGINCSVDTGGSCSPTYSYQWQASPNNVSWEDVTGSTSQNLGFTTPLTQTTYFRRKVTETVSGSIAYSGMAAVFVVPAVQLTDRSLVPSHDSTQSDTTATGINLIKYLNKTNIQYALMKSEFNNIELFQVFNKQYLRLKMQRFKKEIDDNI
jgi:hypothetical protein